MPDVTSEMASLQAGSGGVHVETTGGASLRTRSVSVQLEETGDATLASRGTLDVSARDLRAGGRSVKVSAKRLQITNSGSDFYGLDQALIDPFCSLILAHAILLFSKDP